MKKTSPPAKKSAAAATAKSSSKKSTTAAAKPAATKPRATKPAAAKPAASAKKAPAKKAPARAPRAGVAKVSPLAGMAVTQWITQRLSGWQAQVAARLVDLVHSAVPDAAAAIKWAQPVFVLNGPFAYLRGSKEHVTFGFWRGAELKDPRQLLEGDGDRMKHLKIPAPGEFEHKTVHGFIVEAARLNRDKGDPTKR